jgi:NADH:ubiquinone oxidoreductase subunit E
MVLGGSTMVVTVCVGSGCHIKGAYRVINRIQDMIARGLLNAEVELKACLCQGHCTRGVVVMLDGKLLTGVTAENIDGILAGNSAAESGEVHEHDTHQ